MKIGDIIAQVDDNKVNIFVLEIRRILELRKRYMAGADFNYVEVKVLYKKTSDSNVNTNDITYWNLPIDLSFIFPALHRRWFKVNDINKLKEQLMVELL